MEPGGMLATDYEIFAALAFAQLRAVVRDARGFHRAHRSRIDRRDFASARRFGFTVADYRYFCDVHARAITDTFCGQPIPSPMIQATIVMPAGSNAWIDTLQAHVTSEFRVEPEWVRVERTADPSTSHMIHLCLPLKLK